VLGTRLTPLRRKRSRGFVGGTGSPSQSIMESPPGQPPDAQTPSPTLAWRLVAFGVLVESPYLRAIPRATAPRPTASLSPSLRLVASRPCRSSPIATPVEVKRVSERPTQRRFRATQRLTSCASCAIRGWRLTSRPSAQAAAAPSSMSLRSRWWPASGCFCCGTPAAPART
jgi:hypothetical protein